MTRTDRKAFAELVEPHLHALYRAAYRLSRNPADAEDLVQDVCLRAHRALQAGDRVAAPKAWLLQIQYRLHIDRVRKDPAARIESYEDDKSRDDGDGTVVGLPEAAAATAQRVDALAVAWQALNPEQQALLAYFAEGYSLSEICDVTGLPLTALKARMHRARVRLGKLMSVNGQSLLARVSKGEAG